MKEGNLFKETFCDNAVFLSHPEGALSTEGTLNGRRPTVAVGYVKFTLDIGNLGDK